MDSHACLQVCADTPVGNQMIRGISGGQKKRVTTGEMIVGPKKTLFMDDISTGLDSSTTYQIIKCLRDFSHLRMGTVFISLLQPAPEVYNLFDDIMLLSEGRSALLVCLLCCTTCYIIECLRAFCHLRTGISLLQPSHEVYNLFDDVVLLSEGIPVLVFASLSACA